MAKRTNNPAKSQAYVSPEQQFMDLRPRVLREIKHLDRRSKAVLIAMETCRRADNNHVAGPSSRDHYNTIPDEIGALSIKTLRELGLTATADACALAQKISKL
jgi:hypothetical protein